MASNKESVCPHCGHREPLHGGLGWRGSGATNFADDMRYSREFGGWALQEQYACAQCGGRWEVLRTETDSVEVDPRSYLPIRNNAGGYCPFCGTEEQDETEWGEETITSRGDKVKVEMFCRRCRNWWYAMYSLGTPKVTPLGD